MAGSQEVIREYLVSLGFVVNKTEQREFDKSIIETDKIVGTLGKALLAAAAAAAALATKFATSMDKLYYASQKASSSAANLKAFEYAGRQIGMTSEAIDGMISNLTMTLRTDPGMKGWVESLGVDASEARQGVDIWLDLLTKLREKPFYEGAQFAEMIGTSPDQLFQIETNLDLFRAKIKERLGMASAMGLDQDKAASVGRDLANLGGKDLEAASIAADRAMVAAAPVLLSAGEKLNTAADALMRVARGEPLSDSQQAMNNADHPWWARDSSKPLTLFGHEIIGARDPNKDASLGSQPEWLTKLFNGSLGPSIVAKMQDNSPQNMALFNHLEEQYHLRSGELDYIWNKESGRGRNMLSAKGARGHFGFMPNTARGLGLKNPDDLQESAEAAAKYLSALHGKYGDWTTAEQAYNWGPGNVDRYLGARAAGKSATMPAETQNYPRDISITVNESKTPQATAAAVMKKLDSRMNNDAADLQRYGVGNTR